MYKALAALDDLYHRFRAKKYRPAQWQGGKIYLGESTGLVALVFFDHAVNTFLQGVVQLKLVRFAFSLSIILAYRVHRVCDLQRVVSYLPAFAGEILFARCETNANERRQ
jgi:hypothetical protein